MLLTQFTRKIPLKKFNNNLDPFFDIVVIMAFFMNFGTGCASFMLLNNFNRDVLKFEPIKQFKTILNNLKQFKTI